MAKVEINIGSKWKDATCALDINLDVKTNENKPEVADAVAIALAESLPKFINAVSAQVVDELKKRLPEKVAQDQMEKAAPVTKNLH
ncbi:MAG: hypothetical protein ACPGUD_02485 [Parashewanella sp.]